MAESPAENFDPRKSLCLSFLLSVGKLTPTEMRVFQYLRDHDQPTSITKLITWEDIVQNITADSVIQALRRKLKDQFTGLGLYRLDIVTSWNVTEAEYHLTLVLSDSHLLTTFGDSHPLTAGLGSRAHIEARQESTPPTVFLCHSSRDKERVRAVKKDLVAAGFSTWLDEDNLLPGQDWEREITKAVKKANFVLVCLSKTSTTREGFVHKEIKIALDVADRKPEGTIFVIPVRLEVCILPERLAHIHCVDLFKPGGFDKVVQAIKSRI